MTKTHGGPVWTVIYIVALTLFTAYVLLDAFVIPRTYAVVEQPTQQETQPAQQDADSPAGEDATGDAQVFTEEAVQTDTTYTDSGVSITLSEYHEYNTTIYVADVLAASPGALRTAFAQNAYGRNLTGKTSAIAADNNAVLAINGDYYGARRSGYVIRNGVLYRERSAGDQEDLVVWNDGSLSIIDENDVAASELLDEGAWQVFSFGPALINGGEVTVGARDEVDQAMTSNPRTAIACVGELHYLLVVSDGRTDESEGLTLYQLAEFLRGLGAETAYNLDGGGSSTMYFGGRVVNYPTTNGSFKERSVSDIVYLG